MLYFLMLKEDVIAEAENVNLENEGASSPNKVYPTVLPSDEIQKVIFNRDYLAYINKKMMGEDQFDVA